MDNLEKLTSVDNKPVAGMDENQWMRSVYGDYDDTDRKKTLGDDYVEHQNALAQERADIDRRRAETAKMLDDRANSIASEINAKYDESLFDANDLRVWMWKADNLQKMYDLVKDRADKEGWIKKNATSEDIVKALYERYGLSRVIGENDEVLYSPMVDMKYADGFPMYEYFDEDAAAQSLDRMKQCKATRDADGQTEYERVMNMTRGGLGDTDKSVYGARNEFDDNKAFYEQIKTDAERLKKVFEQNGIVNSDNEKWDDAMMKMALDRHLKSKTERLDRAKTIDNEIASINKELAKETKYVENMNPYGGVANTRKIGYTDRGDILSATAAFKEETKEWCEKADKEDGGIGDYVKAIKGQVTNADNYLFGLFSTSHEMELDKVIGKLENFTAGGEKGMAAYYYAKENGITLPLDNDEDEMISSYIELLDMQLKRAGDISIYVTAGETTGQSMAVMGEFALTGGLVSAIEKGAGLAAMKMLNSIAKFDKLGGGARWILEQTANVAKWRNGLRYGEAGMKTAEELAKVSSDVLRASKGARSIGTKVGNIAMGATEEVAGNIAARGTLQSVINPHTWTEGIKGNLRKLDYDDNGKLIITTDNAANDEQYNRFFDYCVEVASERSGDLTDKTLATIGRFLVGNSNVKGLGWLRLLLSGNAKFSKTFGVGSLFGEVSEEVYGAAFRKMTGLMSDREWNDFFSKDNFEEMFWGMLAPSLVGGAVNVGQRTKANMALDKALGNFDSVMQEIGVPDADKISHRIISAETTDEIKSIIRELSNKLPIGDRVKFVGSAMRVAAQQSVINAFEQEDLFMSGLDDNDVNNWQSVVDSAVEYESMDMLGQIAESYGLDQSAVERFVRSEGVNPADLARNVNSRYSNAMKERFIGAMNAYLEESYMNSHVDLDDGHFRTVMLSNGTEFAVHSIEEDGSVNVFVRQEDGSETVARLGACTFQAVMDIDMTDARAVNDYINGIVEDYDMRTDFREGDKLVDAKGNVLTVKRVGEGKILLSLVDQELNEREVPLRYDEFRNQIANKELKVGIARGEEFVVNGKRLRVAGRNSLNVNGNDNYVLNEVDVNGNILMDGNKAREIEMGASDIVDIRSKSDMTDFEEIKPTEEEVKQEEKETDNTLAENGIKAEFREYKEIQDKNIDSYVANVLKDAGGDYNIAMSNILTDVLSNSVMRAVKEDVANSIKGTTQDKVRLRNYAKRLAKKFGDNAEFYSKAATYLEIKARQEGKFDTIDKKRATEEARRSIMTDKAQTEEEEKQKKADNDVAEESVSMNDRIKTLVKRHGNLKNAKRNVEKTIDDINKKLGEVNNKIAETPATEVDAIAELEEQRTELEKQLNDFGKLKDNMDLRGEISNAIADRPMPEPKVEADGQMRLFNRGAEPYTEVDTEEQKLAAKAVERALDNLERQGIEVEKRVRQAEMWDRVGDDAEMMLKNDGSIDLQLSLYDEQGNIRINDVRRISEDIIAGRSKVDRLKERFEKGRIDGGRILVEMSLIGATKPSVLVGGRNLSERHIKEALPKYYVPELSNDKEAHERLGQLAEHYLIKNDDELFSKFNIDNRKRTDEGSESKVYYTTDGYVIKKRKLDYFEPIDYTDNISLVNSLFPEAGITVEGFMFEDGVTYVVEKQKRINGESLTGVYDMSSDESIKKIDDFFDRLNDKLNSEFGINADEDIQRIDDNTYTNGAITFTDAKYDNFKDTENGLVPIDVTVEQVKGRKDFRVIPTNRTELSISAFHGTALYKGIKPFDKFDWIKHQLQGEGAMIFGAGTYVTGSERIGRGYAKVAKERKDEEDEGIDGGEYTLEDKEVQDYIARAKERKESLLSEIKHYNGACLVIEGLLDDKKEDMKVINDIKDYVNSLPPEINKIDIENVFDLEGRDPFVKIYLDSIVNLHVYQHRYDSIPESDQELFEEEFGGRRKTIYMTAQKFLYSVELPDDNGDNYIYWNGDVTEKQKALFGELYKRQSDSDIKKAVDKFKRETKKLKSELEELSKNFDENIGEEIRNMLYGPYRMYHKMDGDNDAVVDRINEILKKNKELQDELSSVTGAIPQVSDGASFYKAISDKLGSDEKASIWLSEHGITGVKVPQGWAHHHNDNGKDYNYVIFNDDDININDIAEFMQDRQGTIYGFAEGNKITLSEEGMNPNTPVHEYTHLWARGVEQNNPKLWKKFVDLAKQTDVWDEVVNDPNYQDIRQYESRVASEVLARLTGRLNAQMTTEEARKLIAGGKTDSDSLIRKIKNILNDIWKWIGENVFDMKPEQFRSWEDVSHKAMYDFWSSTDMLDLRADRSRGHETREERRLRDEYVRDLVMEDLKSVDLNDSERPSENRQTETSKVLHYITCPMNSFDMMMRKIGVNAPDGKGRAWTHFMNVWNDARNNELDRRDHINKSMSAYADRLFGSNGLQKMEDLGVETFGNITIREVMSHYENGAEHTTVENSSMGITNAQAMMILAWSRQEGGLERLYNRGVSTEDIENIKKNLDPRLADYVTYMTDTLLKELGNDYRDSLAEEDADIMNIEHYFPFVADKWDYGSKDNIGSGERKAGIRRWYPSEMRRRVSTEAAIEGNIKLDIIDNDFFSLAKAHIKNMERHYNYGTLIDDLQAAFGGEGKSESIIKRLDMMGPNMRSDLERSLQVLVGQDYEGIGNVIPTWKRNLMSNIVASKINFKLHTALKQILSVTTYFENMGAKRALARELMPWNYAESFGWAIENIPQLQERWDSRFAGNEVVGGVVDREKFLYDNKKSKSIKWLENINATAKKWGMSPNALVDMIACSIGAKAIYDTRYKEYVGSGLDKEMAHNKAVFDAEVAVNATQQSRERAFLAPIQTSSKNSDMILNAYQNSSYAWGRKMEQWRREMDKDPVEVERTMRDMLADEYEGEELDRQVERGMRRWRSRKVYVPLTYAMSNIMWQMGYQLPYIVATLSMGLGDGGADDNVFDDRQDEAVRRFIKSLITGTVQTATNGTIGNFILTGTADWIYDLMTNDRTGAGVSAANKLNSIMRMNFAITELDMWVTDIVRNVGDDTMDSQDASKFIFSVMDMLVTCRLGVDADTFANAVDGICYLMNKDDKKWADVLFATECIANAPNDSRKALIMSIRNSDDPSDMIARYIAYISDKKRCSGLRQLSSWECAEIIFEVFYDMNRRDGMSKEEAEKIAKLEAMKASRDMNKLINTEYLTNERASMRRNIKHNRLLNRKVTGANKVLGVTRGSQLFKNEWMMDWTTGHSYDRNRDVDKKKDE